MAMHKKKNGSYYTPDYLAHFVTRHVANYFNGLEYLSVFEPSVGDGSFVRAFREVEFPKSIRNYSFTGIDKVKPELVKAQNVAFNNRKKNTRYSFTKVDFLNYQKDLKRKFHLVAGNPPYIKQQLLNKTQQACCRDIHNDAELSKNSVKNIWTAFLVRCSQLLTADGVLAFILPAELLQVKFSSELRTYLSRHFTRTEVFTFDDLLFDCKGQDTVLLFGFKQHINPGQFYAHISNTDQLANDDFVLAQNNALTETNTKWSHHLLSADELNLLHNLAQRLNTVAHYCDSRPGIVTAANSFFIVNEKIEQEYRLFEYTRPIIQKGGFVNGSVVFDRRDFENLVASGLPTKMLVLNDEDTELLNQGVRDYLLMGEEQELHLRYKCKKRNNWFVVPNISTVPEGFFFKRSHNYPKLLKNNADVLVTDSAYKIEMRPGFEINHMVYSFYNSLTLTFAELYGRYYGGGVLELTPSEFKALPIPYIAIGTKGFNTFTKSFENKNEINDILAANDYAILNASLGLSSEEIVRIKGIYRKLISKRLRVRESKAPQ